MHLLRAILSLGSALLAMGPNIYIFSITSVLRRPAVYVFEMLFEDCKGNCEVRTIN